MSQLALPIQEPRRRRAYYPTTPLTAAQMAEAIAAAEQQDAAVVAIFRRHAGQMLTPSRVWEIGRAHGSRWLLTSVRRSITTLTDDGVLAKTNVTVMGPHGRPECCWSLHLGGRR